MTASEHTLGRASDLYKDPALRSYSEDAIIMAASDALATFCELAHSHDLGEPIDALIRDIAKARLVRAGAEGVTEAKDGEMSRKWSEQGMDPGLMARIKSYRRLVGVNATNAL